MPTTDADPLDERLWRIWQQAARGRGVLPGEPTLAQELSISRPAVREALIRLEERGYIHRRRGADTVVNSSALDIPARFDQRMDKAELIAAMGRTPTVLVLSQSVETVSLAQAQEFQLVPGTPVLRISKCWSADGVPVMLARDTLPLRTTADAAGIDPSHTVFDLVVQLAGQPVEWEFVWPDADNLEAADAATLRRPAGEAALSIGVTGLGRSGAVLYWAEELHVRQAFRYAMVRRALH